MTSRPAPVTNPRAAATTRRPRKVVRAILAVLLGMILLLALLTFLLPALVSTPAGTRLVVRSINAFIPGEVGVDSLRLRWGAGQTLAGVSYADGTGQAAVDIERIEAPGLGIRQLLAGGRDLGEVTIVRPRVRIEQPAAPEPGAEPAPTPTAPAPRAPRPEAEERPPFLLPPELAGKLRITDGAITYAAPGLDPVEVSGLDLALDGTDPNAGVTLQIDAELRQGELSGSFTGHADARRIFDESGALAPGQAQVAADFSLASLPVAPVDRMLGQEGRLAALLGATLSAQGELLGTAEDFAVTLEAKSDNVDARVSGKVTPDLVRLADGTRMRARVTPEAWSLLAAAQAPGDTPALEAPFDVEAAIAGAELPRSGGAVALAELALRGNLALGEIRVRSPRDDSRLALRDARLEVESPRLGGETRLQLHAVGEREGKAGTLDVAGTVRDLVDAGGAIDPARISGSLTGKASQLPLQVADELLGTGDLLVASLGPALDLEARADLAPGAASGDAVAGTIAISADSAYLDLQMAGSVENGRVKLGPEGGTASLAIQPAAAARWVERVRPEPAEAAGAAAPPLAAPATVKLTVAELDVPLAGAPLEDARARARIDSLPIPLLDALAGQEGKLVALLGAALDQVELAAEAVPGDRPSIRFTGRIAGERLKADASGQYTEGSELALRSGSTAEIVLTPEAAEAWLNSDEAGDEGRAQEPLELIEPARVQLALNALALPFAPPAAAGSDGTGAPAKPGIEALRLDAEAALPELALRRGGSAPIRLRDIRLAAQTDALGRLLTVTTRGALAAAPAASTTPGVAGAVARVAAAAAAGSSGARPAPGAGAAAAARGTLEARIEVNDLLGAGGAPPPGGARYRVDGRAAAIPVAPLDTLLGTDGELLALLGPDSSLTFTGELGGAKTSPIDIVLESPRTQGRIAARATEQELALREPAWIHATVSPELAGSLLKRVNPILRDAIASEQPVKLTIQSQGFAVPRGSEAGLGGVRATGRLELGTLTLKSGGLLSTLLDALERRQTQEIRAVVAPIDLALADGVLSYSEGSITVDNLIIEAHGKVDLVNSRVDLITGVSGQTLTKAFSELRDVIDPTTVIEIPLRGPIDDPKLDMAALATEVAALGAKAAIRKNLGGKEGEAAGAVIDLLLGGPRRDERQQAPQPQQQPAPGATGQAPQPQQQPEAAPLNQILDILQKRREKKP